MHLCTVHMQRNSSAHISSTLERQAYFATFMSVTFEIFVIDTLNFRHMCMYVFCIFNLIIEAISEVYLSRAATLISITYGMFVIDI